MGGFFFGCAQRKPRVFQGGDLRLPRAKARGFLFVRAAKAATPCVAHRDIMRVDTNQMTRLFLAQIATSYKLDLSDLCPAKWLFEYQKEGQVI